MPAQYISWRRGLFVLVCLSLVAGCQPAPKLTGELRGKITFKGAVVTDAKVQIQSPETGYADGARVDSNGEYKISSPVPAGTYTMTIEPFFQGPVAGASPDPVKPPERPDIPTKYRSGATSELVIPIVEGMKTFDVDMTDKE